MYAADADRYHPAVDRDAPPRLFRASSVLGSLGVYVPTSMAHRLMGFVRFVLLTWVMSPAEVGLLQIGFVAINVISPLSCAGLYESVSRYVPLYETRGELPGFLRRIVPFVLLLSAVVSMLLLAGAEPLGRAVFAVFGGPAMPDASGAHTRLAAVTCLAGFALTGFLLAGAVLKGLRMFRAVSLMELVHNTTFTLAAVGVALAGGDTAGAVLTCFAILLVAVTLAFAPPLAAAVRKACPRPEAPPTCDSRSLYGRMLRFGVWAALAAVMWQLLQQYPLWYLQKVHGPGLTGVFGAVRNLTQGVLLVAMTVVAVLQTQVARTWEARGRAEADAQFRTVYKATAILLLLGCALGTAAAPLLIRVFPAEYARGAEVMALSLLSFLLTSHLGFLGIHFQLIERTGLLFAPSAVSVAGCAAAGWWLIQAELDAGQAMRAAAWTAVLGGGAGLTLCLLLLRLQHRPFDRGSLIVLMASLALLLPPWAMLPAAGAVGLAAARTNLIMDAGEKASLRAQLAAILRPQRGKDGSDDG